MTLDLEMWRVCCHAVVHDCKNEYAKSYARAGMALTDLDAIQTQALYILNNIVHWRGEHARQVRYNLKRFAGEA